MRYFLLAALFAVVGCATKPPADAPPWIGKHKNACLPEAIAMAQGLREKGVQARVLRIQTPQWGHAICSYLYPPGGNTLWGWDSHWKSNRLRAWVNEPESIAREWLRVTMSSQTLTSAQFLD
jgi:hypothetical protein